MVARQNVMRGLSFSLWCCLASHSSGSKVKVHDIKLAKANLGFVGMSGAQMNYATMEGMTSDNIPAADLIETHKTLLNDQA